MRWLALLLTVGGCNGVFGLDSTQLSDAAVAIDAAPPHCPQIGTAPSFGDDLHQLPPRNCEGYVVGDNGYAMANCQQALARGPADGELTPLASDQPVYDVPRLAADGEHVFLGFYNATTNRYELRELAWADGLMTEVGTYAPPTDTTWSEYYDFSTASRGPDRRIVYTDYSYTTYTWEIVEISDGTGAWTETARYPMTELGDVFSINEMTLSPDGLRMLFIAQPMAAPTGGGGATTGGGDPSGGGTLPPTAQYTLPVYYTDRASRSDHFGKAQILQSVPDLVTWPFMTEDCGRIYFSALNRIFYLKQSL